MCGGVGNSPQLINDLRWSSDREWYKQLGELAIVRANYSQFGEGLRNLQASLCIGNDGLFYQIKLKLFSATRHHVFLTVLMINLWLGKDWIWRHTLFQNTRVETMQKECFWIQLISKYWGKRLTDYLLNNWFQIQDSQMQLHRNLFEEVPVLCADL